MIHSMTGYAIASVRVGSGTLNLEIRTVNARFLDLHFRLPDELRVVEPTLRDVIGSRLTRGKVDCRGNWAQATDDSRELALNAALLEQLGRLQTAVLARLPGAAPLSVGEVLRWNGMLGDDAVAPERMIEAAGVLARQALDDLVGSRRREGEKLAAMILERVLRMRERVAGVAPRIPELVLDYQARLTQRLREAAASLDEDRIRTEVGVFATRIDVAEEISRLNAHLTEVQRVLEKGGAAGKRLDFLMQELNREANTLASKSVAGDVTDVALELKLLIEQMREQVQNIE